MSYLAWILAVLAVARTALGEGDLDDAAHRELHERVHANVVKDHEKAEKGALDVSGLNLSKDEKRPTPKHMGERMIRVCTPDQVEIGYFKSMKTEVYPDEEQSPFISKISFVFDTPRHAHKWVRSTVLTNATPEGWLPMSVAIREGIPDARGYTSRAARVLTTTEEIDSVPWILGTLSEDSFLDSSSEFDWAQCPIRGWEEDRDASRSLMRDCAILFVERAHVYDKEGNVLPEVLRTKNRTKKPAKEDMTLKLQEFLEKNRQRKGKLEVEMIIKENDDTWWKSSAKFVFLILMLPLGIWLYKKKKDMDLRSEKII